jgi:maleate isomerase
MMHVVKEELAAMDAQSLRCAAELADARVDVMGYACLVAIMAMGLGYHRESQAKLADVARNEGANSPVISSAGALISTLQELGFGKVAILAPYMKPLTQTVVEYIEAEGIDVCAVRSLEISDNLAVGRRPPSMALDAASQIDLKGAQALILSACVQMPAAAAIDAAEQKLGLPVVTASSCTVRQMLKALDIAPVVPGFGAALSSYSA